MKHGVIKESVVAVRSKNDSKSEMINQMFFGETFTVKENEYKWLKITSYLDNYDGWIEKNSIIFISENDYKLLNTNIVINKTESNLITPDGSTMIIPIGCQINSADYLNFNKIEIENNSTDINIFLNSPYLWGGKTKLELIVQDYHKFILEQKIYLLIEMLKINMILELKLKELMKQKKTIYVFWRFKR